jgi:AraC-like DNA-binding protein
MEVIAWIGCSQALFSGLVIGTKKSCTTADKLLSAWLILMGIEFATYGIDLYLFGDTPLLSNPFLLFNPALYMYARALTDNAYKLRWVHLLHLLPYIFFESGAYLIGERMELNIFFSRDSTYWFRIAFGMAALLSWSVYPLFSILVVHRHRMNLQNEFSTIESFRRISWLLFVLSFNTIYWLSILGLGLYNVLSHRGELVEPFNYSVLLLLTYILGFYGLKQERVLSEQPDGEGEKYKRSHLRADYKERVQQRLLAWFETQKPYLDSDLTINMVAHKLKVPRHDVTEVLNASLGKNFYQFVNEYRVAAVKKMLADPKYGHLSIEAIGFECGFNSKSTFFAVFKSLTGTTPAQYQAGQRD